MNSEVDPRGIEENFIRVVNKLSHKIHTNKKIAKKEIKDPKEETTFQPLKTSG